MNKFFFNRFGSSVGDMAPRFWHVLRLSRHRRRRKTMPRRRRRAALSRSGLQNSRNCEGLVETFRCSWKLAENHWRVCFYWWKTHVFCCFLWQLWGLKTCWKRMFVFLKKCGTVLPSLLMESACMMIWQWQLGPQFVRNIGKHMSLYRTLTGHHLQHWSLQYNLPFDLLEGAWNRWNIMEPNHFNKRSSQSGASTPNATVTRMTTLFGT